MGALVIHSIPSGTSRDIRHLLMRLLKRNAKERMEFGKQGFRGTFVRILVMLGTGIKINFLVLKFLFKFLLFTAVIKCLDQE